MVSQKNFKIIIFVIFAAILQALTVIAHAEEPLEKPLGDWSSSVIQSLNNKVNHKLHQIVMESQIQQNIQLDLYQQLPTPQIETAEDAERDFSNL